jgi:hypothetical protein
MTYGGLAIGVPMSTFKSGDGLEAKDTSPGKIQNVYTTHKQLQQEKVKQDHEQLMEK